MSHPNNNTNQDFVQPRANVEHAQTQHWDELSQVALYLYYLLSNQMKPLPALPAGSLWDEYLGECLLSHLRAEFHDIEWPEDWDHLKDKDIPEELVAKLHFVARRRTFKGLCEICKGWHHVPDDPPPEMEEVTKQFLAHCQYTNLAPISLNYYKSIVNKLARYFPSWPARGEPLEAYLDQFAPRNKLNHYNILSIFFRFAAAKHGLPNPMLDVPKPRVKEKPLPTLYPEQAKEVEANLAGPVETGIFGLMYGMGWRLSEVRRARFDDISDNRLVVHGKERDETVPLQSEIREALLSLRDGRSPESPIFWGQRGPLGNAGIRKIVKRVLKRVGIDGAPHMLRHGYGTALALQGCDAHTIMRLMRHKKLNQAITYINMTDRHLAERQRQYCPLDMVKTGNKKGLFITSLPESPQIPLDGNPAELLPQLLDEMITLGEKARYVSQALGGNGHRPEKAAELIEDLIMEK